MSSKPRFVGEKVKLGELISKAKVERCGDRSFPVYSMTMHDGIVEQSGRFKKTIASRDTSSYKVVKKNQLVVGFPIDEGVIYVQNHDQPGIMSPAYNVWDFDSDRILPAYLEFVLHSPQSMAYYAEKMRGTTARRRTLTGDALKNMPVPVPSIEDQHAVVKTLNCIKSQLAATQQMLDKLDQLVKSRFVAMFGDPTNNEFDFPVEKLGGLGLLERGKSKHRPRNAPELRGGPNGPYPLIQTGDIANAGTYLATYEDTYTELGLLQSRIWPKGTLCITIAANIAKTSILAIDACFPDSVVGFTTNGKVTNLFMHYWFSFFQSILEKQAPQAAQKNINLRILQNLDVIAPPLALQQEFADFVAQVDKSRFIAQQQIEKLQMLYDSLAQDYFGD